MRSVTFDISAESQAVLRLILEFGTIRGFELRNRLNLDSKQLSERVRPLLNERLVMASETVCGDNVDRVHFAPLPYAIENASAIFA